MNIEIKLNKDENSYSKLIEEYLSENITELHRYARKLVGSIEIAEDLVSDAILTILKRERTYCNNYNPDKYEGAITVGEYVKGVISRMSLNDKYKFGEQKTFGPDNVVSIMPASYEQGNSEEVSDNPYQNALRNASVTDEYNRYDDVRQSLETIMDFNGYCDIDIISLIRNIDTINGYDKTVFSSVSEMFKTHSDLKDAFVSVMEFRKEYGSAALENIMGM